MGTYCDNPWQPRRRTSRSVKVGGVVMGGDSPVVVQSMITCDTMDTQAAIAETMQLAAAGCQIVRITAPTVKDARNLEHIKKGLVERQCEVPIVADIHFKPEAALEAARWVDKVRINPGNFADSKKFTIREYTDEQYAAELERIRERFTPLVQLCKERGIAMRIGTNHGSLSDRIMNRYGDTPLGMVESALEFARIARSLDYHELVFSMKSSNPKVMIQAYRLLCARLREEGEIWNYPIHLGVTEAGDGEDGRIKSAIGIGSLLADGIGDTIRVSLTEDSVHEIPVASELVKITENFLTCTPRIASSPSSLPFDPFNYSRRASAVVQLGPDRVATGGHEVVRVAMRRNGFQKIVHKLGSLGDFKPDFVYDDVGIHEIDPRDTDAIERVNSLISAVPVSIPDGVDLPPITAFRLLAARIDARHPIVLKDTFAPSADPLKPFLGTLLAASINLGALLCDGIGDAVLVQGEEAPGQSLRLAFNILQASGVRIFKTDYVACPSCGRTLFNLQTTTTRIKAATSHLKGVRIAVMGCIVNGPGEMADADFGYVGGAPGKVNLYVGKTPVKFNIPESEAVERLVDLIKQHGKWLEPPNSFAAP